MKLGLRINSGIYKGKAIFSPSLKTTRSTKNIVKGSFFDTFRMDLKGKNFIECFGGSGAMALEAFSNGAKTVFAIEKDKEAFEITRKNFKLFDIERNAILGDTFVKTPKILDDLDGEIILYLDPPFQIRDGFSEIYSKVCDFIIEISDNQNISLIAIEHMSEIKFEPKIGNFSLYKSKKFGSTTMSYFVR